MTFKFWNILPCHKQNHQYHNKNWLIRIIKILIIYILLIFSGSSTLECFLLTRVTTAQNKNNDLGLVIIMTQIMTHSFENTDLIMTYLVKKMSLRPFSRVQGHKSNILNMLPLHLPIFSYSSKSQVKFSIF